MINIFQPYIGQESLKNLESVFASNWLGRGDYVSRFENRLSEFLGVDILNIHTIASCTDAIFGVFDIFDLQKGDEVVIPSISFPAIGSAILKSGLIPKIIDIDPLTGNISIDNIGQAISHKTKAIFLTHYGGIPVDVKALRAIVGGDIFIFEDSACAFGTYIQEEACGTHGDFSCWSFDAMKMLVCGEGGAMYFRDKHRANLAKEYFYLGLPAQAKSGVDRQALDSKWWEYQLLSTGRRSVFTNINAAIGLPQFDSIYESLSIRSAIREYYCGILDNCNIQYLRQDDPNVRYSNYFFTITCDRRDELALYLRGKGIYSTFRYFPLHKIDIFSKYSEVCVNADNFANSALNIPIHHSLKESEIENIGIALSTFFLAS